MNRMLAIAAIVALTGCASPHYGPKQSAGGLLGGIGGAVAGAQFGSGSGQLASTAAGALIGAFIGQEAGLSLDRADRLYYRERPSQQVPTPYRQSRSHYGWSGHSPSHARGYDHRRAMARFGNGGNGGCRYLAGTTPFASPAYACQTASGRWFITQ